MRIWRISNFADLSGAGGNFGPGRWHHKGLPIVYCADHPSTSLLEILVHSNRATVPAVYQLLEIELPDDVSIAQSDPPNGWESATEVTRAIGTAFLQSGHAAVLRVPSVIMPKANNLLINPEHAHARRISIIAAWHYPFDSRLFA